MPDKGAKKPGILILTPFFRPNIGGVETHLHDLCEYLRGRGYQVYVLTYQPLTTRAEAPPLEIDENLEIHRVRWPGYNLFHKLEPHQVLEFFYLTPRLWWATWRFLRKNKRKINLIHAQGLNAAFIGRTLAGMFNKKLIVSTHAIYNFQPGTIFARMVKWAMGSADRLLAISQPSRDELIKIGLPPQKIERYRYWVDQTIFKPYERRAARRKLGWDDNFTVLFVGRLIPIKGIEILLEVASRLPSVRFVFIGDGPLAGEVEAAAGRYEQITFLGGIENSRLPLYYSAADILCVPSQYSEALGRVMLEAISCGCPVLAARAGGIPEIINESIGILILPTVPELDKVISELHKNPERVRELGRNCRRQAEKICGLKNAGIIEKAYQMLLV